MYFFKCTVFCLFPSISFFVVVNTSGCVNSVDLPSISLILFLSGVKPTDEPVKDIIYLRSYRYFCCFNCFSFLAFPCDSFLKFPSLWWKYFSNLVCCLPFCVTAFKKLILVILNFLSDSSNICIISQVWFWWRLSLLLLCFSLPFIYLAFFESKYVLTKQWTQHFFRLEYEHVFFSAGPFWGACVNADRSWAFLMFILCLPFESPCLNFVCVLVSGITFPSVLKH